VVIVDAGALAGLATGVGVAAELALVGACGLASPGLANVPVAMLALSFVCYAGDRLILAPLYGAGIVLVGELAARAVQLRAVSQAGVATTLNWLGAVVGVLAAGACAAAAVAIAAGQAPGRSVALTGLGALAAAGATWWLGRMARRSPGPPAGPVSSDAAHSADR
jgi:hypothetical protein